eukprot:SAG11_NODE_10252_length_844_cov_0.793289_1_plen_165_part_10
MPSLCPLLYDLALIAPYRSSKTHPQRVLSQWCAKNPSMTMPSKEEKPTLAMRAGCSVRKLEYYFWNYSQQRKRQQQQKEQQEQEQEQGHREQERRQQQQDERRRQREEERQRRAKLKAESDAEAERAEKRRRRDRLDAQAAVIAARFLRAGGGAVADSARTEFGF